MKDILATVLKGQHTLQNAVTELCKRSNMKTPGKVLTKQTADDDIEAYLELFERIATRENWPRDQWANNLMPFLTGEAQQACRDLPTADAADYTKLKKTILAQYGYSLPAKAQRVHQWSYNLNAPARPQVKALQRLVNTWLTEGDDGPSAVDRVVLDRCVRALPSEARKYVAQQGATDVERVIALLENHQVTQELVKPGKMEDRTSPARPEKTRLPRPGGSGPRGGIQESSGTRWTRLPQRTNPPAQDRRCFICGREGHFAKDCPERDVSMPTADNTSSTFPCGYLTTGWAEANESAPRFPVKVMGQDAEALLDSGSVITLVRPELVEEPNGEPVVVACIHGDTKSYPTSQVKIQSPRGTVSTRVGIVPGLPVPVLIGRDCALFNRYWSTPPQSWVAKPRRPSKVVKPRTAHAWAAPSPQDSLSSPDAEETGPRQAPVMRRQTAARRQEELRDASQGQGGSIEEHFSEFMQIESTPPGGATEFSQRQHEDPNLAQAWRSAVFSSEEHGEVSRLNFPYFSVKKGLLYRNVKEGEEMISQLLVPRSHVSKVLYLAHSHALGAHLGMEKTYERVTSRFYWPGVKREVEDYCRQCAECQLHSPKVTYRNPLIPLPIIDVPFKRIGLDIVGPLPKSSRGHRYILVLLDYATRYPEAIPLRTATGKAVAKELFLLCSRVGIPEEILTDQGSCFMSNVMKAFCQLLKVKQIRTSVYHPQTDGLVERFNKTLKQMLRKMIETDGKDWDQLLPYLLFAIREVPQASTGFSPFELLYGRRPRGLLDLAKEAWEEQPTRHTTIVEHVEKMHQRMSQLWPMVRDHMHKAQEEQARLYNRGAQVREFSPGDKVLVLIPTHECKFLAKWHGPYEVVERTGPVNYRVRQVGRRHSSQIYHVNLLKRWYAPRQQEVQALAVHLPPPEIPQVPMGEQLSPHQVQDLKELLARNRDVFSDKPGRTSLVAHDINTEPGKRVRLKPYRIPETRRQAVREEVKMMLEMGVIEESHSPWSSPIVLVPKPDGTWRFCNDFRKLNEVSAFDAYPMPRADELIERLGPARFISTLDLTRGYWQVPLTNRAKEKTAFSTPEGLFQYRVLPFGVHGAPATFQRLMDKVLRPHREYAAAYLDDILIQSPDWQSHLQRLEAVLGALREAGLTAKAAKCRLGQEDANYLGFTVGRGCVRPQTPKVEAITTWPRPNTKRQVRTFLGLVGYYRQFIPEFASLAAPLFELTKTNRKSHFQWNEEAEEAFQKLKDALCHGPVLATVDYSLPLVLQTDASMVGLGAVLSQVKEGIEQPIMYISRKLLKHERNYATVEKECLAIKWAIDKLRYHLVGREFTLVTDHAPLKWMSLNKDRNSRITRWFLELQNYKFKVEHRAGKLQGNCDALSRREECLLATAPRGSLKLMGRVCGTPSWARVPTRASRHCAPRGEVIEGTYYPTTLIGSH